MPRMQLAADSESSCSGSTSSDDLNSRQGSGCLCWVPRRRTSRTSNTSRMSSASDDELELPQEDGLGGMGAAVASVVGGFFSKLPEAKPRHPNEDLRRYIRAGDFLNLLGGNMWGHVVLLLATPLALENPVLYEMDDPEEVKRTPVGGKLLLREAARRVTIYVCKILQSASNMQGIDMSTTVLVVHPRTGEICVTKPVHHGVQICSGLKGRPVTADIIMSPFDHQTLNYKNLILTVEETCRAPQDTKWSFTTAVRSYLRNAELWPRKYGTNDRKRKLAQSMDAKWRKRPVCSTVPPRVWQKYLLKECYQVKASGKPRQDPEVDWAERVLRFMPIKDDRVLPEELVRVLLKTTLWTRADLARGPPQHRLYDTAPPIADFFNAQRVPPSYRPSLPPNLMNPDGVPVVVGSNKFNIYCGRNFDKPQQVEGRLLYRDAPVGKKVPWDGCCGPRIGPQCSACRWLQVRLPNIDALPVIPAGQGQWPM
eukprot:TRINITY_DN56794_c0_g1_i1.p1 TRINITY_DN56794_c0_g1~~TRINITY_DN56794_c0_g1_i1.p1  ORF type:complete len:482 (+),score=52.46 TRINITY_DN56794_c0_g1_i1:64-1509(+)